MHRVPLNNLSVLKAPFDTRFERKSKHEMFARTETSTAAAGGTVAWIAEALKVAKKI